MRTAFCTPRMAERTSLRPGASGPLAGALVEELEGPGLLFAGRCVPQDKRQAMSPRQRAAHELPVGADGVLLLLAVLFVDGALGVFDAVLDDELRGLRVVRSARLLGSLPDGAVPLGCVVPVGPAVFAPLFAGVPAV